MITTARITLPEPVQRYFDYALTPGQPPIRGAWLRQSGTLRNGADRRWMPFTATERISTDPIAFTWEASVSVLGFVSLHIRDTYERGEGSSEVNLQNLLRIGGSHGTPEMAAASLVRYLAEAPWFPSALLPSQRLSWTAVDPHQARATLRDGATEVSAEFAFGTLGEIVRVTAQRYRDVGGSPVLTPWTGHFRRYRALRGMMIPTAATVSWISGGRFEPVWRGRILEAEYGYERGYPVPSSRCASR